MIDHVIINVSHLKASKAFYKRALAPLGYKASPEFVCDTTRTAAVAFMTSKVEFMIAQGPSKMPPVHVAFQVSSRALVKAFHQAALTAGGKNFGKPKLYREYHKNFFGAFVRDPDGHNIEAVCHEAE